MFLDCNSERSWVTPLCRGESRRGRWVCMLECVGVGERQQPQYSPIISFSAPCGTLFLPRRRGITKPTDWRGNGGKWTSRYHRIIVGGVTGKGGKGWAKKPHVPGHLLAAPPSNAAAGCSPACDRTLSGHAKAEEPAVIYSEGARKQTTARRDAGNARRVEENERWVTCSTGTSL